MGPHCKINLQIMTISEFDHLGLNEKKELLLQCCGSGAWVEKMIAMPPAEDLIDLFEDAEECWYQCEPDDWKEAFTHHPRIGDLESLKQKFGGDRFAGGEQSSVSAASSTTLQTLADANREYEQRFGYIFIVCASGCSATDMLEELRERLNNSPEEELQVAMDEQNKITRLRLEKLFEA